MEERLRNETEVYDNDLLERGSLNSVLKYCYYYSYLNLMECVRNYIQNYLNAPKLEIGSHTWYSWFYMNSPKIPIHNLTCINISKKEITESKILQDETGQNIEFVQGDAHTMPFENSSFDLVYGSGILHHLELDKGIYEIKRILSETGIIIFEEPLDINPIYKLFRWLTPWQRTKDERALRISDLSKIRKAFHTEVYYYNLLSIPLGLLAKLFYKDYKNPISKIAWKLDSFILKFPLIRLLASKAIIVGGLNKDWKC